MSEQSTSSTSFRIDAKKWTRIDRTVLIATLILFISLFLPWYGWKFGGFDFTASAINRGYMWIPLIVSLAIMGYLVLLAGMERLPFKLPLPHERALMVATAIDLLFAIIAFLDKPGFNAGWRYGAFVGLIAAAVAYFPFAKPMVEAFRSRKSTAA